MIEAKDSFVKAAKAYFQHEDPNPPKLKEIGEFIKACSKVDVKAYSEELQEMGWLIK